MCWKIVQVLEKSLKFGRVMELELCDGVFSVHGMLALWWNTGIDGVDKI